MAGLITHLVIAREILKKLPEGATMDAGLFYAGSIAPDAIHAREGYIRADKRHTHFRDDILDKDFGKQENLEVFRRRVADFIMKNRSREDGLLDLYRGYVVHVLTDELYIQTVREEFCDTMEKLGIAQSDPLFFEKVIMDMNQNDFILMREYEGIREIQQYLENVQPSSVEGYLSERELEKSRAWVLSWHFNEEHQIVEPAYIKYQRTLEFISMAVDNIIERLSEGGALPRMF